MTLVVSQSIALYVSKVTYGFTAPDFIVKKKKKKKPEETNDVSSQFHFISIFPFVNFRDVIVII